MKRADFSPVIHTFKKKKKIQAFLFFFLSEMFRDTRPIALRRLMPFTKRSEARKHRTSDSIHSTDEDPLLLDEEAGVRNT